MSSWKRTWRRWPVLLAALFALALLIACEGDDDDAGDDDDDAGDDDVADNEPPAFDGLVSAVGGDEHRLPSGRLPLTTGGAGLSQRRTATVSTQTNEG